MTLIKDDEFTATLADTSKLYPKFYVLLGLFTFLEELVDGEYKAIIHEINDIKSFDTSDEACEYGETILSIGGADSYLVPQIYGGAIEIDLWK